MSQVTSLVHMQHACCSSQVRVSMSQGSSIDQSTNRFLSGIEKKTNFYFQRFKAHVPLGIAKVKHMLLHEFLVWTKFSFAVFRNASLIELCQRKKGKNLNVSRTCLRKNGHLGGTRNIVSYRGFRARFKLLSYRGVTPRFNFLS